MFILIHVYEFNPAPDYYLGIPLGSVKFSLSSNPAPDYYLGTWVFSLGPRPALTGFAFSSPGSIPARVGFTFPSRPRSAHRDIACQLPNCHIPVYRLLHWP